MGTYIANINFPVKHLVARQTTKNISSREAQATVEVTRTEMHDPMEMMPCLVSLAHLLCIPMYLLQ